VQEENMRIPVAAAAIGVAAAAAAFRRMRPEDDLAGEVAVVTGASRGLGLLLATELARRGCRLVLCARDIAELDHAAARLRADGASVITVACDVTREESAGKLIDAAREHYGRLDILINNAGIQVAADSDELSAADFDKVLAVNLRGAFLCARQAVRSFLSTERPGVIVNVSSVHQLIPKPRFLGYSVSKGGMQNLTRSLALEYAGRGIRVNGIGPGATVTLINRSWIDDPVKRRMVEEHIPMRRAGGAEEMAAAAAFLCSDEAAYITGQTLFIDGGLTLYPSFETTWSSE
jgi:glucose 1-dehydrogenase